MISSHFASLPVPTLSFSVVPVTPVKPSSTSVSHVVWAVCGRGGVAETRQRESEVHWRGNERGSGQGDEMSPKARNC